MSGYDIKRFLEDTVSHFWSESYGQIYPTLRSLEAEGSIRGEDEPGRRGRTRRVFRLTRAGRRRLRAWLRAPAAPVTPRYEHSLKIFFGHEVPADVSREHVDRLRRDSASARKLYGHAEEELRARAPDDDVALHRLAVLRGGVLYSEMVDRWCDEVDALLDARDGGTRS
jgi:DNA-binding PadR family transcriptional regulator